MLEWIIGVGILLVTLLIFGIGAGMVFVSRLSKVVTCLIVNDAGNVKRVVFKNPPESFTAGKRRYIYDERAVFRMGGKKYVMYRESIPEPISVHLFKNPKVLSSVEFETVIKAEVHRQLFGASAIGTIKIIAFIILGVTVVTLLISLFTAFSGQPDAMVLSGDNVTRQIIEDSVRRAIGR